MCWVSFLVIVFSREQYSSIHRFETNKLRNVAKFFGHLLYSDGLDWGVLEYIKLTEGDTTSSSRIFLKILFQVCNGPFALPPVVRLLISRTISPFDFECARVCGRVSRSSLNTLACAS
jgi:hypothetical protein